MLFPSILVLLALVSQAWHLHQGHSDRDLHWERGGAWVRGEKKVFVLESTSNIGPLRQISFFSLEFSDVGGGLGQEEELRLPSPPPL